MPRTKVSKSSKRHRELSHVRIYENQLESYLEQLENIGKKGIFQVENKIMYLFQRTQSELLQMKMADIFEIENLLRFKDWKEEKNSSKSIGSCSSITSSNKLYNSARAPNPNDEGYLTEDSTQSSHSVVSSWSQMRPQYIPPGRTPGPLNSARARKQRRSRSACGESNTIALTASNSTSAAEHIARSKLRTPVPSRTKAISADRSVTQINKHLESPAAAFLRWPKPGEIVLSTCGSPVVAQVLPDKYANVNIPVLNGVLSLRPKKLSNLQPNIVNSINKETMEQIKTLHANLDFIMNMAERGNQK